MGTSYLVDTNAISKGLRGLFPENGLAFFRSILIFEANFSVVTRIELLGFNPEDAKTEQTFRAFIEGGNEFGLTEEIIRLRLHFANRLRSSYRML